MRAYEITPGSSTSSIKMMERSSPKPGHGEVLIDVKACSLNYRDLLVIRGTYTGADKKTGTIPLSDGAGVVSGVGEGVIGLKVGDRVAGGFMPDFLSGQMTAAIQATALGGDADGMLAEQVVLPARGVVKIPDYLSFAEASTLPCAAVTAWYSLFVGGSIKPGDTVLLLGTGGVSMFALQFAKKAGARVIITSSDDEKLKRAALMGADEIVNYRTNENWETEVLALTGGKGVDLAIEVGGPGTINKTLACTRFGGTISLMGVLTGLASPVETATIMHKNVRIQGTYVGSIAMFEEMNRALAFHEIKPVIDQVFAFDAAADALAYLESAKHFGKVVIAVN